MPDVKEQVNRVGLAFAERGLKFEHVDSYENPLIKLPFGGGDFSYSHLEINLVFDLDGASAHVVTSPIASVPGEKTAKLLLVLNECNRKFRWVKFYLDEDNDIIVNADVIIDESSAGAECLEIVMRTASIVDNAYADIMKGVWG